MAQIGDEFTFRSAGRFSNFFRKLQFLGCRLEFRDVARDAEGADDLTVFITKRQLACRYPCFAAIRPDGMLFMPEHILPCADQSQLIRASRFGIFFGKVVTVHMCQPHQPLRTSQDAPRVRD